MASRPAAFDRTPLPTLSCSFNNSGPEGSPWSPVRGRNPIRGSVAERLLDIRNPDELAVDGPSRGGDATFLPNLATLGVWVLELFAMYATDGSTDGQTKATLIAPFPTGHNKRLLVLITNGPRLMLPAMIAKADIVYSVSVCICVCVCVCVLTNQKVVLETCRSVNDCIGSCKYFLYSAESAKNAKSR